MASADVTISNDVWTLVATGTVTGYLTNECNYKVVVRQEASLPAPTVDKGHTIADVGYNYSIDGTENVYARVIKSGAGTVNGLIVKTEG